MTLTKRQNIGILRKSLPKFNVPCQIFVGDLNAFRLFHEKLKPQCFLLSQKTDLSDYN